MNKNTVIEILEALASGCSPTTGEIVQNDSILNERVVIRALQIALDNLKEKEEKRSDESPTDITLDEAEIKTAIELFTENRRKVTANSLVDFFLGTRNFKNKNFVSHSLYGKFKDSFTQGQLLDLLNEYLSESQSKNKNKNKTKNNPYSKIDFFRNENFNTLSESAIKQLKEKINGLGIVKTENLSDYIQRARIQFPRAYEPWSEIEKELLRKAINYTNDLNLLSECFQRGKGSIESCGQRIIYESQNLEDNVNKK